MADPFVAEVRIFGFFFAPKGWAFCEGQLIPISQNTALFSLLGTTYGGNGKSTFALPNMTNNACMHPGQGKGLSLHDLGEQSGTPAVTLTQAEMPVHQHGLMAQNFNGSTNVITANDISRTAAGLNAFAPAGGAMAAMAGQAIGVAGGNGPHNNMMPFLGVNFCIAMQGIFPPRT
jgi:microcystin-dependent protein